MNQVETKSSVNDELMEKAVDLIKEKGQASIGLFVVDESWMAAIFDIIKKILFFFT